MECILIDILNGYHLKICALILHHWGITESTINGIMESMTNVLFMCQIITGKLKYYYQEWGLEGAIK